MLVCVNKFLNFLFINATSASVLILLRNIIITKGLKYVKLNRFIYYSFSCEKDCENTSRKSKILELTVKITLLWHKTGNNT